MANKNSNLNTDRLSDPRRRELPLGGVETVGLAGLLGGGVWSIPAEALAVPSSKKSQSGTTFPFL
ncbi:hypothetical protein WCU81_13470 [Pectobacterium atrosepticum]|uniref:hypothetical protein n=1 Tax=Pectobacterium atrosepticum TaxID=29471 RepID=UPI00039C0D0F|nr:hypothetical protein [Pectobacterium atrosepticum]GKV86950.1 hypothetical protein PEC301296_32610 [Pectobacterium carotovorum subsp. carotovorum]AIA72598.1 hypothetical protein EV46_18940 [Pectobacterium atrosepticum]AIK15578.1 hypothetical protein GZ59_38610 [Pectobacterium atrosepticum]ATY92322.1 hypothetical protein CVS35_19200 [Pectobacterium atrosepticum]KFX14393.1 hypothetical protein JV34_11230 [Pectobacterium atrosepticum]